ncbi:MAG TPA: NADH-quinone oxidoreductase subunit M [Dongiaceae bacterium]|nr:NADH-quinone oxidoreductase subunit M [Dongiaceae bacterium]
MMLPTLISILFLGGLVAWCAGRINPLLPRWVALITLLVDGVYFIDHCLAAGVLATSVATGLPGGEIWFFNYAREWIPQFGIQLLFAADCLSLVLNLLTILLGIIAVMSAWNEIKERSGFFYFNLLWTLAGVVGIFSARDLFLFFFFWEVMLIPMYFIISLWGHENRVYAALKFFIFTQLSGLLMLLSIVALVFFHHAQTGIYTFDSLALRNTEFPQGVGLWVMLGFFVAFTVKLPSVPFHTWLPDAHTQAPTAGSVILAGLLLKTGAYGLIRFILPLFPEAAASFAPIAMSLGVISILYAAKLAFAQHDLKRLIAYTSVSHMGFILLGVFSANVLALQGAVLQMLAHGISSAALFALAGSLQHRLHTRDIRNMGGLSQVVPRTAAVGMFFAIAALGMPGLGNFVGETLVLFGSFQANRTLTILAALGLILAPVYALKIIQSAFHGEPSAYLQQHKSIPDFSRPETIAMAIMVIAIVWLGIQPQPVIRLVEPALTALLQPVEPSILQTSVDQVSSFDYKSSLESPSQLEQQTLPGR